MKKIFSLFAAVLFAGSMIAAESVVYDLVPASGSNNSYAGNCDIEIDGITWNLNGNSQQIPWRLGGKSLTDIDRTLFSKTALNKKITKIEVEHGNANSITVNSFKVIVASDASFENVISTLTPTFEASKTATINCPEDKEWNNAYYKFVYNVTVSSTSNKFLEFVGAKFYGEEGGGEESDCKWDEIDWVGGEPANQYKVCKEDEQYPGVVNIQKPGWAAESGIYLTFPSAVWGEISLEEGQYVKEGAGMIIYLSALTAKYTDITVECYNKVYAFTIYNDKGTEPAAEEVELNITKGVMFTDAVEEEGWWQVRAMNDHYFITLSNAGTVAAVAGTYTAAQLDEDYSYVNDLTEEIGDEGYTDITFTEGSVTVTVAQDGKVSFVGALTGSDGKIYNINIVYADPKPETTVTVTTEGEIEDYIESMDGFFVGAQKDNVYVQVFIYSDQIAGEYTIEDLDPQYSYIKLGEDEYAEIYSATIKIVANADGSYTITADVLCYGDVLYKITVTIPGDEPTAIDNAKIADKIRKAIINGNVVIEKSNILYNVNGAIVR